MKHHKSSGFTLIELFLAVLILGVVVAGAVPAFSGFMERQRISAQAEAVSSTLSTARSEAVTRLTTVDVCWNQTNAAVTLRGFSLEPGKMAILIGDPAEVIRDFAFSDGELFVDDSDADDCVSFLPSGRFDVTTATKGVLRFGVCKELGETADSKAVVLNATGRASTVKNSAGAIINCS